ncbi:hypothetical protein COL30_26585 [Bacillus pseudomycoides]|uniref:Uncharacterized protein n=2 Tax=Bacillus pseudomycoides TaxID=64104 RepID=A0A2C3R1U4_9BACI|nr:hypothetical protein CON79_11565 [Bacillus pseudomycoides]PEA84519.1 hypothetical protein CON99_05540 [Bacillus pseudomycoides]PED05189.1 hypothetical protein COO19_27780 [Bacillus pseudomycoides]PED71799.1 hypothetical protein CON97_12280 [Bacillus pseudomycoides]PEE37096.1 hypothetical protein COO02_24945 [Bacillus pseudomycoides]
MPPIRSYTYIMMNSSKFRERRMFMYPYNSYAPYNLYNYQQSYDGQSQYQPYIEQTEQIDPYDPNRQFQIPISFPGSGGRQLERRVNELEQRVNQLQQTVERHTRRLNRLNQRLRTVENRLNIPFSALEDGF